MTKWITSGQQRAAGSAGVAGGPEDAGVCVVALRADSGQIATDAKRSLTTCWLDSGLATAVLSHGREAPTNQSIP